MIGSAEIKKMKQFGISLLLVCFLYSCKTAKEKKNDAPNIVYILADDLGYGELGVYGQKLIETPHIDALAKRGIKFTQHYSGAPVCAPARSVLLTGLHAGHTPIRGNDEWKSRGEVWNLKEVSKNPYLEGQRPIRDSIITIAEVLKTRGYKTAVVGKWGLGGPQTEGIPTKQGFDFFYGYNCQRQAHTYYPMHLWKNDKKVKLNNKFVALHASLEEGVDINDNASYADFNLNDYAPKLIHDEALQFMERNADDPFFLYYASPIPHVPLQAPKKWVNYYRNKFGEELPYTGKSYYPNKTPIAAYAAMISYLDEQVGELVAKLKELGVYENTLIVFTSDNGPTYTGGANTKHFKSAHPFKTEYGATKGYLKEGGIRVPMIAVWEGKIHKNSETAHISSFYDVMATFGELSGAEVPKNDGISFLPALLDKEQKEHEYLYWEFPSYGGQQAVRLGKWKGIRKDIFKGNMNIELFNLEGDIQEQTNVAQAHPEIVEKIAEIMSNEHTISDIEKFKIEALGDK